MLNVTQENFEKEVMKSDVPVFLDFWAPWCGFCVKLGPTVDELEKDFEGKYKFGKINVDENPSLAAQFGVMSIPVTMVVENGQLRSKVLGAYSKEELIQQHNL